MSKPILAWHFLTEKRVPDMGTRRKPLYLGHLWREKGPPVLYGHGLHASERILDALRYAPGPVVCRVTIGGTIVRGDDKLVGTRRRILAMGDITNLLHEWACDVAEEACRRAGVTDHRILAKIACKRQWIRREATDEDLQRAGDAAWDAALGTAHYAAMRSVQNATQYAPWKAALGAAGSTLWVAAWDAAARDAAWDEMGLDLEQRILREIGADR